MESSASPESGHLTKDLVNNCFGGGAEVAVLLESGTCPNSRFEGWSPLAAASLMGHSDTIKVLLEHGAKVNMQPTCGGVALVSCTDEMQEFIKKLLPANVNRLSLKGQLETLTSHGAKINILEDGEGLSALMIASLAGRTEAVRVLIAYGAQVNMQDCEGRSALMWASHTGYTEVVQVLIANGAQVSMQDNNGGSALLWASIGGHLKVVWALGALDAQVDMQDRSALIRASCAHPEVVRVLISHGAQVNMRDKGGMFALMGASCIGCTEAVQVLIEHGAQVNMRDTDGASALMEASHNGNTETVRVLLAHGADINMKENRSGNFSLLFSSLQGHTEIVKLLLNHAGVEVNMQNNYGGSALMEASKNNHIEIVKLLLHDDVHVVTRNTDVARDRAKAQVNLQDNRGVSALSIASANGFSSIAQILLKHGAQINMQNIFSQSALSLASMMGQTEMVKLLLHHKAEVNLDPRILVNSIMVLSENLEQMILISCKMHKCDDFVGFELEKVKALQQFLKRTSIAEGMITRPCIMEIIELLLQHGVDVNNGLIAASMTGLSNVFKLVLEKESKKSHSTISTDIFLNSLEVACFCGNTEIVRLILEHSAEACNAVKADSNYFLIAIVVQHEDAMKWLLEDMFDDNMVSLFILLMKFGSTKLLELLLNHGAKVNALYPNGHSPLIVASATGRIDTVKCLLTHGAEVNMQGIDGLSALVAATNNGHYETVKLLLDHNAEVNMTDSDGDSALIYAVYRLAGKKNSFPFLSQTQLCEHKHKYVEIIQILLSCGAKDCKNKKGLSAQILASNYGITEVVKMLIDCGAQIDYEAVEVAIERGNTAIVELLLRNDQNAMLTDIGFCPESQSDPVQDRVKKPAKKLSIDMSAIMKQMQINVQNKFDELEARLKAYFKEQLQEVVKPLMLSRDSSSANLPQLHHSKSAKKLELKNVLKELYPLASEWKNIGALLGLPSEQLTGIKSDHNEGSHCLREMIIQWLRSIDPDPSWEQLVEVLKIIHPRKAAEIHQKYCT